MGTDKKLSCLYGIKMWLLNTTWRKKNKHNHTTMMNPFNMELVQVGKYTYGGLYVLNDRLDVKLKIGNFCSIAQNVVFLLGFDHPTNHISTYPFKVMVTGTETREAISKGDIVIDDDVWIAYGAQIMSGVHIHQGAIVAAGAVVTKDVPAYAIVGGVPAKVLKYRFEESAIEELLKIDYEHVTKNEIVNHLEDLYCEVTDKNQIDWMQKK